MSARDKSGSGFAVSLLIWCAVTALGVGAVVGGKVALGVLALLLSAGFAISEVVIRGGSDRAVTALALARPFFYGGWLIAVAAVTIAAAQSLDWVVYLPLGLATSASACRWSSYIDDPAGTTTLRAEWRSAAPVFGNVP